MNTLTMKWLLRREFWEHKGSMFWAPVIVALLLVVLVGGSMAYGFAAHGVPADMVVNGRHVTRGALAAALPAEMRQHVANIASAMYIAASAPLFIILTGAVFFYCLGALYDERRDRSILFWKSLPVSDTTTVLSKVVTALCVAPVITIALGTIASLALLLIGSLALSFAGVNILTTLLASPNLYLQPLRLLGLLPVYMVWALPTIGWLLLVSSWARTKPFLWAVGVPLIVLILAKWISMALGSFQNDVLDVHWFSNQVVGRALGGLVPGIWFAFTDGVPPALRPGQNGADNMQGLFVASWMTLATAKAWIGALLGAAMIFGAMRLRRWRDEG
jgi:ABC-2 type transport system permease protein